MAVWEVRRRFVYIERFKKRANESTNRYASTSIRMYVSRTLRTMCCYCIYRKDDSRNSCWDLYNEGDRVGSWICRNYAEENKFPRKGRLARKIEPSTIEVEPNWCTFRQYVWWKHELFEVERYLNHQAEKFTCTIRTVSSFVQSDGSSWRWRFARDMFFRCRRRGVLPYDTDVFTRWKFEFVKEME